MGRRPATRACPVPLRHSHCEPSPDTGDDLEDTLFIGYVERVMADARAGVRGTAGDSVVLNEPATGANRRMFPRRPVTRRVTVGFRTGVLGLGQNLGIDLVDATLDGLAVRLRASVAVGAEVSVEVMRPGVGKPMKLLAEVRWCRPVLDGTFLSGVRLRRRLTYLDLTDLTR